MKKLLLILITLCSVTTFSQASQAEFDFAHFKKVLVLQEGRIKPLDTYARDNLLRLQGKTSVKLDKKTKISAVQWYAELLFVPDQTKDYKVFLINHRDAQDALGLKRDDKRMYSFNELKAVEFKLAEYGEAAGKKESKNRTALEAEFYRVHQNFLYLDQVMKTMKFDEPSAVFTVKDEKTKVRLGLAKDSDMYSYFEVLGRAELLGQILNTFTNKKREDWNEEEKLVYDMSKSLYDMSQYYQNIPFFFIPIKVQEEEHWVNPWVILGYGLINVPHLNIEVHALRKMQQAYQAGDAAKFKASSEEFYNSIKERADWIRFGATEMEVTYNKMDYFFRSQMLYGLSLLMFLLSFLFAPKWMTRGAFAILIIGFILHITGMLTRMYITWRPPITNLYETFIFVSAVCVLMGIIMEWLRKDGNGIFMGSLGGLAILWISLRYAAEGDTLGVLIAVLDSNFWLSTHVITINLGYAGVAAAGILGHVYIIQSIMKKDKTVLHGTYQNIFGTLGFGLCLSFIGTVLGGIWADQSWGRFWGWDPKENGALLIVLWSAMIYHARLGGWVHRLGFAALSVFGVVILMFAWFGINLLGVGLHSYGFTEGVAFRLNMYYIIQTAFILIATPIAMKRGDKF